MNTYRTEIENDAPGSELINVYRVGALGDNAELVNTITGKAAREYIDRFIADCEERDYEETIAGGIVTGKIRR